MRIKSPCLDCGEVTQGTRCENCSKSSERLRIRKHSSKKRSATQRGYDSKWKRLSERARAAQPFCSDCGATDDLQADHLPEAWERYGKGLPLRLVDVDVVCGRCNRKRGAARGPQRDSEASSRPSGTGPRVGDSRHAGGRLGPGGGPLAGHGDDSPLCPTLHAH